MALFGQAELCWPGSVFVIVKAIYLPASWRVGLLLLNKSVCDLLTGEGEGYSKAALRQLGGVTTNVLLKYACKMSCVANELIKVIIRFLKSNSNKQKVFGLTPPKKTNK